MSEHDGDCGDRPTYGPWVWSAYKAYNELLRDKIKKQFEKEEGPWMDELAKVLVELVNARWEGGRQGAKQEEAVLEKLNQLLSQ